jgi:hypothetical protein
MRPQKNSCNISTVEFIAKALAPSFWDQQCHFPTDQLLVNILYLQFQLREVDQLHSEVNHQLLMNVMATHGKYRDLQHSICGNFGY